MGIDRSQLEEFNTHYREFILGAVPFRLDVPYSPARRARLGRIWLDARFSQLIAAARGQPITGTLSALDWTVVGPFTAAAVLGAWDGRRLAARVSGRTLQRVFGTALLAVAALMLVDAFVLR